jgi:succinate--hydroxymethylglutarate CoA-transferase
MKIVAGAGCPASYVFDTEDLFTDPHLKARGFIQYVDHPENGRVPLMRQPLRMRGINAQGRAPLLGEHTDEVLTEVLGYDHATLEALRADGVTVGRPLS